MAVLPARPDAERGVLRPLAPPDDADGDRRQDLAAAHRRGRGPSPGVVDGRPRAVGERRGGGREPVLGQLPQPVRPEGPRAQWRNGAMGNARWAGVGLAKVLRAAGVRRDAVQVTFDGLDEGPLASVPDFVKALDIDHALQPEVTVAYSMNGEPLPALNGFPARLVVPGWYATYWVKALHKITVLPHAFDGYWMAKAYKIPATPNGVEDPHAKLTDHLIPINRMNVRSFVTTPEPGCDSAGGPGRRGRGDRLRRRQRHPGRRGLGRRRFDLGRGRPGRRPGPVFVPPLALSLDPGVARASTASGRRATAGDGQVQPDEEGWNRGGYMRNVVEEMTVHVA